MIVGLTGGIGSGKTTVAKVFETMGCVVYNSDERAKALYFNSEIKKQIVALLGAEAYINEVTLNKNYISNAIFTNKEVLTKINGIIHPAVKNDFEALVSASNPKTIIVKETALLFEEQINKQVDFSVLVTAPTEIKIQRVMLRNNTTKDEVLKRMANQWTDEQKHPLAQFVILNDGIKAIIPQVEECIKKIKQLV